MELVLRSAELTEPASGPQRLILRFHDSTPADHPDPVTFTPTVLVEMTMSPGQVEVTSLVPDETSEG